MEFNHSLVHNLDPLLTCIKIHVNPRCSLHNKKKKDLKTLLICLHREIQ